MNLNCPDCGKLAHKHAPDCDHEARRAADSAALDSACEWLGRAAGAVLVIGLAYQTAGAVPAAVVAAMTAYQNLRTL